LLPATFQILDSADQLSSIKRLMKVMRLLPILLLMFSCAACSQSQRFIWPTDGKVISPFDLTRKGIDIAGKAGQPIVAASDDKVLWAKEMRGYGNLVILEHSDSIVTAYAHNKTILVREGQTVTQNYNLILQPESLPHLHQ
jgi:hypothetical protein